MKHASPDTIQSISKYLNNIRNIQTLKEKKEGIFYKGTLAFIHFHEDNNKIFADLKINKEWQRFSVNNDNEWNDFFYKIKECV